MKFEWKFEWKFIHTFNFHWSLLYGDDIDTAAATAAATGGGKWGPEETEAEYGEYGDDDDIDGNDKRVNVIYICHFQ